MTTQQTAQRSIIKKYRKPIWNRFIGALKEYKMLEAGDRVAVCISGGKDSMLLAMCMQELENHGSEVPFRTEFLVMDPGYAPENRKKIEENAATLGIPIHIFDAPVFNVVDKQTAGAPCYLCARMRRGYLYKYAKDLGCNKIALGHHFDDVIETTLMSMLYGAEMRTMMPKLHSTNFEGMQLIRPLYFVREADILSWQRYNGLSFIRCACRMTAGLAEDTMQSKRQEVKWLIAALRRENPQVDSNIFRSADNVNLETIRSWHKGDATYDFLDEY